MIWFKDNKAEEQAVHAIESNGLEYEHDLISYLVDLALDHLQETYEVDLDLTEEELYQINKNCKSYIYDNIIYGELISSVRESLEYLKGASLQ